MLPSLGPVPTHGFFVGLGVLAAVLVFVHEARRRGHTDDRLLVVVTGALVGGALFMRLGTWLQHVDLRANATLAEQWAYGNRSILGGLVGAWLGVHVAKRLCGYPLRTGDLFAPAVALGMAVGRIGCLLTELPGTPTGASWGITLDRADAARLGAAAGVPLHPSFAYEIAFHLAAFAALWFWLRRRDLPPGESFVWYVAAYGIFRFLVEFVRGNEVAWEGLTRPQLFLTVTIPFVLLGIVMRGRSGTYSPDHMELVEKVQQ
jgi:phosphatidylglycerol:prolipoprotein diacylglycerol transferase